MEVGGRLVPACVLLVLLALLQILVISLSHSSQQIALPSPRIPRFNHRTENKKELEDSATAILPRDWTLNPRVRTARKELHFFNHDSDFAKGVEWYKLQMPLSDVDQVTIEKTPGYFTSENAPQRVYELNPHMKLILILRNPVTRIVSDYTQNKSLPVFEEVALVDGKLNTEYKPVRNSLYALHMKHWLRFFPLSSFLLLDGDRFVKDPLSQLRLAERFLDVPPLISSEQLVFNASKGFFCFRRHVDESPRCLGESKGRQHRSVSPSALHLVYSLLRPHNADFMRLVNRVFDW